MAKRTWKAWCTEFMMCSSYEVLPHYLETWWLYPAPMALKMLGEIWTRADNVG